MHTETEIRMVVRLLLELHGELNTTEVKDKLQEVLDFDEEDNISSKTRPGEVKITQRIGNIVSHQRDLFKIYPEGFAVDKNYNPAKFIAITGLNKNTRILKESEIKDKQNKAKVLISPVNKVYKKLDWNAVNERRTSLGKSGEEFVLGREIERVRKFAPDDVSRVYHTSENEGDGFGYDILSLNRRGQSIYIEVKTTTGGEDAPFFMSINEKQFFEVNQKNAFVYRVFNFNQRSRIGEIKIISGKKLMTDYIFDPITFLVKHK